MPIGLGKKKSYLEILYLSKKHSYADKVIEVIQNVKRCDLIKSFNACSSLIDTNNYNVIIVDELTLNPTRNYPKDSFELIEKLYKKAIKKNSKVLFIVLMEKIYPEFRNFNFVEGTLLFLIKDETKMTKLSYIISLIRRRYYRSILFSELKTNRSYPVDIYHYNPKKKKYFIVLKIGEKLTDEKHQLLEKHKVNNLYVLNDEIYTLFDYRYPGEENHLFHYTEKLYSIRKKYRVLLMHLFNAVSDNQMNKGKLFLEESMEMIKELIALVNEYSEKYGPKQCLDNLTYPRWNVISHGINCAIESIVFNQIVKIAVDEEIGFASMFHNVGLYDIDREIIDKSESELSLSEKSIYETHIKKSLSLLTLKRVPINDNIRDMIKYHHENFDGTGYPEGLTEDELPLSASLLSMVGSFDYFKAYTNGDSFTSSDEAFENLKVYNTTSSPLKNRFHPLIIQQLESFFSKVS